MRIIETERLILRKLNIEDAKFIFKLVNDSAWLQFIGDKGVKSLEDARHYILNGPADMYERLGFGMFAVELKHNSTPIGICGLLKRDFLEEVDIGFAFLPEYRKSGYAHEAANATIHYGISALKFNKIAAMTVPDNHRCIRLLQNIGLRYKQMLRLAANEPEIMLFTGEFDKNPERVE